MRSENGFVYMVLSADKAAAKIGFTVSPYARLAQLQSASHAPLLEQETADRQLAREFYGDTAPVELSVQDVCALL